MAKQQGKLTMAQKQAASAAANQANLLKVKQQAAAEQPLETALTVAMRSAQQTATNETLTVTVIAETGNGGTVTSQETLPPVPVAEPVTAPVPAPVAAPVPVPVPALLQVPSDAPTPAPQTAPVVSQTLPPVPTPVVTVESTQVSASTVSVTGPVVVVEATTTTTSPATTTKYPPGVATDEDKELWDSINAITSN